MVAYLKVYLDDSDWQWFGIRYKNDTDKKQSVADCKVTQITLDYDTIMEEENHHSIKTTVFITDNDQEIPMNGKFSSGKIAKLIGNPPQIQMDIGIIQMTKDTNMSLLQKIKRVF